MSANTHTIAVACRNASGEPDCPVFTVTATTEQVADGEHYKIAQRLAADAGYEKPFLCFDANEGAALGAAARALGHAPTVVAVDLSGGRFNSALCDGGSLKVICYDADDDGAQADNNCRLPLDGPDAEAVECWTSAQEAQCDPFVREYLHAIEG